MASSTRMAASSTASECLNLVGSWGRAIAAVRVLFFETDSPWLPLMRRLEDGHSSASHVWEEPGKDTAPAFSLYLCVAPLFTLRERRRFSGLLGK